MGDILGNTLGVIIAQAVGVTIAWKSEALSWGWRHDQNSVLALKFLSALTLLPPLGIVAVIPFDALGLSIWLVPGVISIPIIWLLLVAGVQKTQLKVSLSAAFFGAFLQLFCFGLSLVIGGFFLLLFLALLPTNYLFPLTYLVSAILAHALLSLFRPAIYGTWNTYQQNSGKN